MGCCRLRGRCEEPGPSGGPSRVARPRAREGKSPGALAGPVRGAQQLPTLHRMSGNAGPGPQRRPPQRMPQMIGSGGSGRLPRGPCTGRPARPGGSADPQINNGCGCTVLQRAGCGPGARLLRSRPSGVSSRAIRGPAPCQRGGQGPGGLPGAAGGPQAACKPCLGCRETTTRLRRWRPCGHSLCA